ncbi:hypothetical protein NEDG_01804 [Nematocida displodere]|uniref:Uncharacterized protein n=1 Tax=Nematocida displodere TaxID=1805483 RepID=A0A177EHX5_9MICR|nr:hypothetical protein NEDG_01804 [Nematocida displodere]
MEDRREETHPNKKRFAGPSFNASPNPEDLPIPTIPEGYTLKKPGAPQARKKGKKHPA